MADPNIFDTIDPVTGTPVPVQLPAAQAPNIFDNVDPRTGEKGVTAAGMLKASGAGIVEGAESALGIPGDVRELAQKGSNWISGKIHGPQQKSITTLVTGEQAPLNKSVLDIPRDMGAIRSVDDFLRVIRTPYGMPSSHDIHATREKHIGELYEPQNAWERGAKTVGEFVPGAMIGSAATLPTRLLVNAVAPGAAMAGAGEALEGSRFQTPAKIAAALAAPAIASKMITPLAVAPGRAEMANTLRSEGVRPTAGDITGNETLKYFESQLKPGGGEQKADQFTRAASRRVGEDAAHITGGPTGVFNQAMTRTGKMFEDLSSRNVATADAQLATELGDLARTYNGPAGRGSLYSPDTVNAVNAAIHRVIDTFRGGPTIMPPGGGVPMHQMTGANYQTLRSNLQRAARGATDPQKSEALHEVVNALDDAMERSIAMTNPSDSGAWGQARRQYRNMLVIENALARSGESAAHGTVTPEALAAAAKQVYGKRAYLRGTDDFSELSQAGVGLMKPPPNSGTSRRMTVEHLMASLGGTVGGLFGAGHSGFSGATEGAIAGMLGGQYYATPLALAMRPPVRAAVMNPATQAYLSGSLGRALGGHEQLPLSADAARQLTYARALAAGVGLPAIAP